MGCDIHLIAEQNIDHTWRELEAPIVVCDWHKEVNGKPCIWCCGGDWHDVGRPGFRREPWWSDRSYWLFGVLAGVRNYYANATPIAEPRGLPADASEGWVRYSEPWEWDLHSHSWLTTDEVLAYDWAAVDEDDSDWFAPFLNVVEEIRSKAVGPTRLVFAFDN